jgi:guanylate kinase
VPSTHHLTDAERIIQQNRGALEPLLVVIAGPSGVGKNTIIRELLANHADVMDRIRTYTTRTPREGEVEGEQYHFVSFEEFRRLAEAGALMEADEDIAGHPVYGTDDLYSMPSDIYAEVAPGKHIVIAEVDVVGADRLRAHYPDCVTIFVTTSVPELMRRIRTRHDETMNEAEFQQRMEIARKHIREAKKFDYLVFNHRDQMCDTLDQVETIIRAERMRIRNGLTLDETLVE